MLAAERGHVAVVEALLANGANINAQDEVQNFLHFVFPDSLLPGTSFASHHHDLC